MDMNVVASYPVARIEYTLNGVPYAYSVTMSIVMAQEMLDGLMNQMRECGIEATGSVQQWYCCSEAHVWEYIE